MNPLLIKMARQIHRRLIGQPQPNPFLESLVNVRHAQRGFRNVCHKLRKARQRGWKEAAKQVRQEVMSQAHQLQEQLVLLAQATASAPPPRPSLRLIIEELQQLHDEFEEVQLCMNQHGQRRIKAVTEPITLEEVELGRFSIELDLHRLSTRCTSACFDCKALEPNYASSDSGVTHPHVQGNALCAGEATLPIANALSQGRICDAFCLVRSVLTTYNPESPYVALENWHGVSCDDCDRSIDPDYLNCCEHCGKYFCDDCISNCEICDQKTCNGCLEGVELSGRYCCPDCRHTCSRCGRTVSTDDFNDQTKICTACEEEEENHEQSDNDNTDNSDDDNTDADQRSPPVEQPTPDDPIPPPDPAYPDLLAAGVAETAVLPARR